MVLSFKAKLKEQKTKHYKYGTKLSEYKRKLAMQ